MGVQSHLPPTDSAGAFMSKAPGEYSPQGRDSSGTATSGPGTAGDRITHRDELPGLKTERFPDGRTMTMSNSVLTYFPAVLKDNKAGCYVEFYVLHPSSRRMIRRRIKLNRIAGRLARKTYGRQLASELNRKLASGWNPITEAEASRAYYFLTDAMADYLTGKAKETSREDTIRSYRSYIKVFLDYMSQKDISDIHCIDLGEDLAVGYMDHIYAKPTIGNRTFNNYLNFMHAMCSWLIAHRYLKRDPFGSISKKIEQQKERQPLPPEVRDKIRGHLQGSSDPYLLPVLLAYGALIRPKEIGFLRISQVDLERGIIQIKGAESKNRKPRIATLPGYLVSFLKDLDLDIKPAGWYLCGRGFRPGEKKLNKNAIGYRWASLRLKLDLAMEYKFYSLRDTGIIQMLEDNIPAVDVKDQADHSSLAITEMYTRQVRPEGVETIKRKATGF